MCDTALVPDIGIRSGRGSYWRQCQIRAGVLEENIACNIHQLNGE